jgi:hypothetical protein
MEVAVVVPAELVMKHLKVVEVVMVAVVEEELVQEDQEVHQEIKMVHMDLQFPLGGHLEQLTLVVEEDLVVLIQVVQYIVEDKLVVQE